MAKTTQAKSITGYQFLCEILGGIHQPSVLKNTLLLRAQSGEPMDKEETKRIQAEFVEFISNVKKARRELWENLDALLFSYNDNCGTYDFFEHFNQMDSMYTGLFRNQTGTTNLAGIAMTVVLAAGYPKDPNFYIGSHEARMILTRSMECLGYNNTDFIPDDCFAVTAEGYKDADMPRLMLLSLFGALKVKYPHKAGSEAQRQRNLEKATEAMEKLINSNHDSAVFGALRNSSEMSRICQGMQDAMREDAWRAAFPNGVVLPIDSFYTIPRFETIGASTTEILRRDYNFYIRSLVVGKMGSGKSLLMKAVVRTCLEPAELRTGRCAEYAKKLGLGNNHYLPLVLDCKELPRDGDLEKLDLIEEAVQQLARLTRTSAYASCLTHWDEFSQEVMDYYKRRAKNATLLLIVEDLSWLDRGTCDVFLKKLRNMEQREYARLHILVLSQRLLNSQMARFGTYNRVEIAPLTCSLEQEIETLVSLGVGVADTAYYLKLLDGNRCARVFVDSPKHLVKLLCHQFEEPFDLNELLRQTMEEQLEQHTCADVTDADCREFLTALAVNVAESKKVTNFSRRSYAVDYKSIPRNIVDREGLKILDGSISRPGAVWQYIMDNMILICPNDRINSYAFVNQLYYCSLVADHYLSLMGAQPAVNWLDHFNRLSAEDFSIIIVMLLDRLCWASSEDAVTPAELSAYDILVLIQSAAAFAMSRTEPAELYSCLLALMDILTSDHLKKSFQAARQTNLWTMLKQVYANCYEEFEKASEDPVKLSRLILPKQIAAS